MHQSERVSWIGRSFKVHTRVAVSQVLIPTKHSRSTLAYWDLGLAVELPEVELVEASDTLSLEELRMSPSI